MHKSLSILVLNLEHIDFAELAELAQLSPRIEAVSTMCHEQFDSVLEKGQLL